MTDKIILEQLKIAVVDDHELIREGLNAILLNNGVGNVRKYNNATELIGHLEAGQRFDFYIIDLELPDLDGFELVDTVRARHDAARIIVSTVHDEIWTLRKLMARNVNAIIYKSGKGSDIITAIGEILDGNVYYCDEALRALKAAGGHTQHPSARELEVLHLIAQGKTSREIAAATFVTDNTVEAHRKALFAKLGAVNVADLIVKAIEKGYLTKNGVIR